MALVVIVEAELALVLVIVEGAMATGRTRRVTLTGN